jgi:hypothetical protein
VKNRNIMCQLLGDPLFIGLVADVLRFLVALLLMGFASVRTPALWISSHQSIRQPLVPLIALLFRMSIGCKTLSLNHSYAWLHAAPAALAGPIPPAATIRMRLLSRPLRFPCMGTIVLAGPPLPAPTFRVCSWNTCNMKHLLQHVYEIDEIFRTYSCNICV